jgi:asparagine synthase (glutamine-hydrolysing)
VTQCVQGWASTCGKLVLSVSGGLDSSIVAACLKGAGAPDVHCVTMFGDDAEGDEREYARGLCEALGLPLTECHYRVEDVDIGAPLGAHQPRPFGRTQSYAYEQAHLAVARNIGADAFMTGNGGDNVFGYSQSAAAIADRVMSEGVGPGLFGTLRDVCRQTGCSMIEAGLSALRTGRAAPSYRWRPIEDLLHPDILESLRALELTHSWLEAPPGSLPGKAAHIAALLRVLPNLHPGRSQHAPVLNPLVSQPVMEACLAIPSWQWRAGGFDRAVARAAFRGDLPDLIARRRGKGGPSGFTVQLLAHYRPAIRERLLDGHLAAQRIIDAQAVERVLADERPIIGEERTRLLTFLSVEAWLGFWADRLGHVTGMR